jgi:hypothetical protein
MLATPPPPSPNSWSFGRSRSPDCSSSRHVNRTSRCDANSAGRSCARILFAVRCCLINLSARRVHEKGFRLLRRTSTTPPALRCPQKAPSGGGVPFGGRPIRARSARRARCTGDRRADRAYPARVHWRLGATTAIRTCDPLCRPQALSGCIFVSTGKVGAANRQ